MSIEPQRHAFANLDSEPIFPCGTPVSITHKAASPQQRTLLQPGECCRSDHDLLRSVDWLEDSARDVAEISAGAWTALAAWLAVVVGIAALIYAWRQYQRAQEQTAELLQPNVSMFM